MKKELYIAVDPGFDTVKVIANGQFFKFPFNTEKTDEKEFQIWQWLMILFFTEIKIMKHGELDSMQES